MHATKQTQKFNRESLIRKNVVFIQKPNITHKKSNCTYMWLLKNSDIEQRVDILAWLVKSKIFCFLSKDYLLSLELCARAKLRQEILSISVLKKMFRKVASNLLDHPYRSLFIQSNSRSGKQSFVQAWAWILRRISCASCLSSNSWTTSPTHLDS